MRNFYYVVNYSIFLILITGVVISCTVSPKSSVVTPTASTTNSALLPSFTQVAQLSSERTITPSPSPTNKPAKSTSKANSSLWKLISGWSGANKVRALQIDKSGSIWVGGPDGLVHWDIETGKSVEYIAGTQPVSNGSKVVSLSQTPDGALWVGTFGNGISKFDGTSWTTYTMKDGLPSDFISNLFVTSDGNLWVDTSEYARNQEPQQTGFLGKFNGNQWLKISEGGYYRIVASLNNGFWTLTDWNGLPNYYTYTMYFDGQKWKNETVKKELISAITVAPNGEVWIATDVGVYKFDGKTWQKIDPPWIGKTTTRVTAIAVSTKGEIWFGFSYNPLSDVYKCGMRMSYTEEFGVYKYDGENWTHYTTENGLVDNKICAIAIDSQNTVWFGSFDNGISHFDGNKWTSYSIK
jgi:ligand-binding sensor domain-containing protein